MNESLTLIEKYIGQLDQDIASLIENSDCSKKVERDHILYYLEEAEKNLFFILESLKHATRKIKSIG